MTAPHEKAAEARRTADHQPLDLRTTMRTNTTGYVLISTGSYDDYEVTAFRVLKPFSFAETAEAFKAQWSPTIKWQTKPSPDDYVAWLAAEGYIEDAPEIQEVHVGGYDFDDRREYLGEVAEVVFCPRAPRTPQPADAEGAGPTT